MNLIKNNNIYQVFCQLSENLLKYIFIFCAIIQQMSYKNIIKKLSTTITGGAIVIAFFSVVSKFLGLFRDRLLASYFGVGDTLDIYYAAFKLPDLVFNTLILGALSAAFIPVFIKYWQKDKQEAWDITNAILTLLVIIIGAVSIVVIVFADQLMPLIVPGFETAKMVETIHITRIMFVSVIFFTISNVLSGVLNSLRRFLAFSLAPIFYNLGIIIGIIFLYPLWGLDGLAWGVVLGSILHALVQLPSVVKKGWTYRPVLLWRHSGVRKILRLMIPRTFALGVGQVNQLVIIVIASTLATGSIAIFNLANNLQSLNIIGISFAISCFPVFSQTLSEGKSSEFKKVFSVNVRRVLYIMIPISLSLFLLRIYIVRIVLGAGQFDWLATILTARTLGFFAISLFAQSLIPLFTRAFYALEDTKSPVITSVGSVVLNIVLAMILSKYLGVAGLALAFSIASIVQLLVLVIWLRVKISYLDYVRIARSSVIILFMSFLSGIFLYATIYAIEPFVDTHTFVGIFLQTVGALSLIHI